MSSFRIAHISDSHFGTILPGVREALLWSLHDLKPNIVVLTGDITQRARAWQFKEAYEFVRQLEPLQVLAVPGNHDIPLFNLPARLFWPLRNYRKFFRKSTEAMILDQGVAVLALNSTFRFYHIQGRLNLQQTEEKLKQCRDQAHTLVVAFHHPMDCAKTIDEKNLLKNRHEVVELFEKYKVDLVINGHIHDPFLGVSTERYPLMSYSTIFSLAGTCTSWRIRKSCPNSFNLVDVNVSQEQQIKVSRFDINAEKHFVENKKSIFYKNSSRGWLAQA